MSVCRWRRKCGDSAAALLRPIRLAAKPRPPALHVLFPTFAREYAAARQRFRLLSFADSATRTDPERSSPSAAARRASLPQATPEYCSPGKVSPLAGSISRDSIRASVVFPHPLSPTIANVSPAATSKLTSSTAVESLPPGDSLNTPPHAGIVSFVCAPPASDSYQHAPSGMLRAARTKFGTRASHSIRWNAHRGAKLHPAAAPSIAAPFPVSAPTSHAPISAMPPISVVYRCSGASSTCSVGPCSMIRPAYITATRSAIRATTPNHG